MNNTGIPPIDQQFIATQIHRILIESDEDPDLSWLYPLFKTAITESVLIHTYGNQVQAANLLTIHKETLRRYYHAYTKWQNATKDKNQPTLQNI